MKWKLVQVYLAKSSTIGIGCINPASLLRTVAEALVEAGSGLRRE